MLKAILFIEQANYNEMVFFIANGKGVNNKYVHAQFSFQLKVWNASQRWMLDTLHKIKIITCTKNWYLMLVERSIWIPVRFCKILWRNRLQSAGTSPGRFWEQFSIRLLSSRRQSKFQPSPALLIPTEPEFKLKLF